VSLVFAAIAPHGGLAIEEACSPVERELAKSTRAGMEELAAFHRRATRRQWWSRHHTNVHVANAMGVLVSSRVAGQLSGAPSSVALDVPSAASCPAGARLADVGRCARCRRELRRNDLADAVAPMDWGVLIPLWFNGGRHDPPVPVVVVTRPETYPRRHTSTPAPPIAEAARAFGHRVAFIASADHGHAHVDGGPYGYHPSAARYDALVCKLVRTGKLEQLSEIPRSWSNRPRRTAGGRC